MTVAATEALRAFENSVAIGPEFFRKSFNDYRDRHWAFAREILQNSLDCGSTKIEITIDEAACGDREQTVVTVANNGAPMERETITGKLLSLGSSGKDFQSTVGGFGKAKEILYFAHQNYRIDSGQWWVAGAGAGYDLGQREKPFEGTVSCVTWKGLVAQELRAAFERFVRYTDRRNVTITMDGEPLTMSIPKFRRSRSLEHDGECWAHLGIHNSFESNLMLVRIAGIPMFFKYTDLNKTVVLELQGSSGERLTANRDGLRHPYDSRLGELVMQLTVDRRSALTVQEPRYTRYEGPRLRARPKIQPSPAVALEEAVVPGNASSGGGILVDVQGRSEQGYNPLPFEFVLKNCLTRRWPREFNPHNPKFSEHARWLARAWAGCLLELYQLYELTQPFSVGFVLSDNHNAECERSSTYGQVYYINPCEVEGTIKRRFTKADKSRIMAEAAHEFVHGLGLDYHGEDYANKLTDVMDTVVRHVRKFNRHF